MAVDDERARTTRRSAPATMRRDRTSAPVTLVEYGDYECPHCGRAYPIVKEIQRRLGAQLRFVFRNFPLAEIHPMRSTRPRPRRRPPTQGKFWEMHELLFEHQTRLDDRHLVEYAAALGSTRSRFDGELTSHTHAARVRDDFLSGVRSGVNGTPTFFINGVRHDDSWDIETLEEALTQATA